MEKTEMKKIYIAIVIAIILLAIGFYLYYFFPQVIPGLASTSLKQDVNVLIIGLDDRDSVNKGEISADTLILAQLIVDKQEIKLSNIVLEEKPSFGEEIGDDKIEGLLADVAGLISAELNYYFTISYQGFIDLIDNLDGITVTREEALNIPDLGLALIQGNNNLSGREALNYARWYDYTKDERDRVERQQEIISAIIDKALMDTTLVNIPQMFNTAVDTYKSIETNLEYTVVVDIIEYLMKNKEQSINYDVIVRNSESLE